MIRLALRNEPWLEFVFGGDVGQALLEYGTQRPVRRECEGSMEQQFRGGNFLSGQSNCVKEYFLFICLKYPNI